jgi:DNA invertase Pin-like site-specific DNA recombinase
MSIALIAAFLVPAAPALGQAKPDPSPLWEQFPLEPERSADPTATPTAAAARPSPEATAEPAAAPPASGDTGLPPAVLAVAGVLLLGAAAALRARRTKRRGTAAPAAPRVTAPVRAPAPERRFTRPPAAETAHPPLPSRAPTAVGYAGLAASEAQDAPSLFRQKAMIIEACAREGWRLDGVLTDDPGTLAGGQRPGLTRAIARVRDGRADRLVVARLDRVGDSEGEIGVVVARLTAQRASLVALDRGTDAVPLDHRSALASVSARSSRRTSREQPLGHRGPAAPELPLRERVDGMRAGGMSYQAIADTLNREGVPSPRKETAWRASLVRAAAAQPVRRPASQPMPGGPDHDAA